MSLTKLEICNAALIKLGCDPINDIDEDVKPARLVKARYDNIRRALLRSHPWNFAAKNVELAIVETYVDITTTPQLIHYMNAYQLPSDYLKAWKVFPDFEKYKIEKDRLLANASSIALKYIADVTSEAEMDPQFAEAFSWAIAMDLSYSLVQDKNYRQQLLQEGRLYLSEARSSDAQEDTPDDFYAEEWIQVRL